MQRERSEIFFVRREEEEDEGDGAANNVRAPQLKKLKE